MDLAAVIVSGLFGGGVMGFLQFMIQRGDDKSTELAVIKNELTSLKRTQDEVILRVTRGELKDLMRDDPDNIEAITQVAEYYFLDLKGDAYMHAYYESWAKAHNQSTSWLPPIHERSK